MTRLISVATLFFLLLVSWAVRQAQSATPEQVEADWRLQDQCRLAEIIQPGTVRFVEGEVAWPGISAAREGLAIPQAAPPVLDGRLDDPCWRDAAQVPLGPAAEIVQPAVRLCRDQTHLFVGAEFPTGTESCFGPATTAADASGAVDGIKNGRYGFHTGLEPNPWWQVDLGHSHALKRIVIYNRLDYAPGLHNADKLVIRLSDDGQTWVTVYDNAGKPFGGIWDNQPLVVDFQSPDMAPTRGPVCARFIRIQVPSPSPLFFHLDEVEVYGTAEPQKNLALGKPADQSSRSPWSRGGPLVTLGTTAIGLASTARSVAVTRDGQPLGADQWKIVQAGGKTCVELALPLEELGGLPPHVAPYHSRPTPIAPSEAILAWASGAVLGFGKNRAVVEVRAEGPVELTVETTAFTPQRLERQEVLRQRVTGPTSVPVEFSMPHEGAAALIATARHNGAESRLGQPIWIEPLAETLQRIDRLLADFRAAPPAGLEEARREAQALAERERAQGPDPSARRTLYHKVRWLARQVALMNPALDFDRLLVLKRFGQETYPDVCLNHMPWVSRPGGDMAVVSLDTPDKPAGPNEVRCLLQGALGPGHVHGMDLWFDATRVVFGYAKAKSAEPPAGWLDRRSSFDLRRSEEPTHLFEIRLDGTGLRQLTDGPWSDLDPTYLPSGQIAFVSERCAYSLQCNEYDKDETSCNLYVMDSDGSNIRRLSVTKDGDYLPHTLDDGSIGYTRWEYHERGWAHIQSLWVIRPDGTGADALFKQHLNDPWAVEDCRSIPGSHKLVGIATGHHTLPAGPLVILDPRRGLNSPESIAIVTPNIDPPEGGMSGRVVPQGGVRGRGGLCMTPWPLSETTFLVARNYAGQVDPAGWGIYLMDVYGTAELLYRDPAISCFTPIPVRPRPRPPVLPAMTDPSLPYAVCAVSNVGRGVDGVDPAAIRYIRIAEPLAWPYDHTYGGHRYETDVKAVMINWNPVRVLGTVPVEKDGSAQFIVPPDTAVYFQLLDENFMELRRMRSFISFQPGEHRACNGCHETRAEVPGVSSQFPLALQRDPSVPEPPPWGPRPISFLRDVQPVFDRHCAGCHSGLKPAGRLDFSGGLTARHNRAYDTILTHGLVARSNVSDDARITPPLAFGSHRSRLVEAIRSGPCSQHVKLTQEDWLRLVTWIDANGPYHDAFLTKRQDPPYDLPNDHAVAQQLSALHARRCTPCHNPGDVTRLDWIDLGHPEQSRFLVAPLASSASGARRCAEPVYADASDPDYQAVLALVDTAVKKAWARPRRDLQALRPDSKP